MKKITITWLKPIRVFEQNARRFWRSFEVYPKAVVPVKKRRKKRKG